MIRILAVMVLLLPLYGCGSTLSSTTTTTTTTAAPTVTSITPSSGYNDLNYSLQISGTNFQTGATAKIGSTTISSLEVVNSTTIRGYLFYGVTGGSYDVNVINPDGQIGTLAGAFTANSPPAEWTKETLSWAGTIEALTSNCTILLPDGITYRTYFTGPGGIWTATSTDGISWSNQVLTGVVDTGATNPGVIRLSDGTYLMIYGIQTAFPTTEKLYRATSSNGVTFVKQAGTALIADPDEEDFVSVPDLVYLNTTTLRMYFVASPSNSFVHTAVSTDSGLTWTREGKISIDGGPVGGQVYDPDIIKFTDGTYWFFFTTPPVGASIGDLRIRSATSSDGRSFVLQSGSRVTPSGTVSTIMDPDVILIKGTTDQYRLYYGGNLSTTPSSADDLRAIISP